MPFAIFDVNRTIYETFYIFLKSTGHGLFIYKSLNCGCSLSGHIINTTHNITGSVCSKCSRLYGQDHNFWLTLHAIGSIQDNQNISDNTTNSKYGGYIVIYLDIG